jgi:hypothetical protein
MQLKNIFGGCQWTSAHILEYSEGQDILKMVFQRATVHLQKPFWRVPIEPLAPLRRSRYITKCIFDGNLTKIQLADCYSIDLVSMGLTVNYYWENNICYTPWPDNKWYNNNSLLLLLLCIQCK